MKLNRFGLSERFTEKVDSNLVNALHISNDLYIGSTTDGLVLLETNKSPLLLQSNNSEFNCFAYSNVTSTLFCFSTNQNLLSVYQLLNNQLTLMSDHFNITNNAKKLFFSSSLNILFIIGDTLQLLRPDLTIISEIAISPLFFIEKSICIDEFKSSFIIFTSNGIHKYSDQGILINQIETPQIKLYTFSRSSIFIYDCTNNLTKYDFNLKQMARIHLDDQNFTSLFFIQSSFLLFVSQSLSCFVFNYEIDQMYEIEPIKSKAKSIDFSFDTLSLYYDHQIVAYKVNINWLYLQSIPPMIDINQKNGTLIGFNSDGVFFLDHKGTNVGINEILEVNYINGCIFLLKQDGTLLHSSNAEIDPIPVHSKQKIVCFCSGTFPEINEKVIYAATEFGKLLIFNSVSFELIVKIKLHENSPKNIYYSISQSALIVVSDHQLSLFDTLSNSNYDMTEITSKIIFSSFDNDNLVLYHEDSSLSLFTFGKNREITKMWNTQLSIPISFLKMDFNYIIYISGESIYVMNLNKEIVQIQLPFELASASFADFDLIVSTKNSLLIKIERHHFKSVLPKDDDPPQFILMAPPGTPKSQHFNRARVCRSAQSSSLQQIFPPITNPGHPTSGNSPRNLSPISSRILPPPNRKNLICPRPSPVKR